MRPHPDEIGGVRWWLGREADPEATARLVERALDELASGRAANRKRGRRKQLYPLTLGGGTEPDHLLKVNLYGRGRGGGRLGSSKARHELRTAEAVAERGIPSPIPLAAGERRRGGRLEACYLLVALVPGATDLRRLWLGPERTRLRPAERRALAREFGTLTRRIHDAGIFQDDFAPNNFLVVRGDPPRFLMIDFERARLRRRLSERPRRWMLAKAERELAQSSRADRMRFLHAYAGPDPAEARRWWRSVEAFVPRLARRDAARLRRKLTRDGRSFRRLTLAGAWTGYARSEAQDDALERALPPASEAPGHRGRPSIEACGGLWRVAYDGLTKREAKQVWTLANLFFAHRALVPRPLAMLRRAGRSALLLDRDPGLRPLPELADGAGVEAAVSRLRVSLDALGAPGGPPPAEAIAAGGGRAVLLAPAPGALRGRARRAGWRPSDRHGSVEGRPGR